MEEHLHSGQITQNQELWTVREENHLEELFKFKWAMKTIIAGKCSGPVRKKNAERNDMTVLGERKHNLQRKSVQFYGQEDSSTENEHPAMDSFSF